MNSSAMVYQGEHGEFVFPPEVIAKAESINAGKSLTDRRTRGAKLLEFWGRKMDLAEDNKAIFDRIMKEQEEDSRRRREEANKCE